jgi:prepilin peptidase CpaA
MKEVPIAIQVLLLVTVIPAAILDLKTRRVPNWITIPAALAAIAVNVFAGAGGGASTSLKGLGIALLVYFPLYALRAMGAGDVKLMGAIGAAVGPANWLLIFVLTAILGGIGAIITVTMRHRWRRTFGNVGSLFNSSVRLEAPFDRSSDLSIGNKGAATLPHAVPIALATLGVLVPALTRR